MQVRTLLRPPDPFRPRRVVVTVAVIAGLLLAVGIALPVVVKRPVNDRSADPGYRVQSMTSISISGAAPTPCTDRASIGKTVLPATDIDFSRPVGTVAPRSSRRPIDRGQLTFVKGPNAEESQTDLTTGRP